MTEAEALYNKLKGGSSSSSSQTATPKQTASAPSQPSSEADAIYNSILGIKSEPAQKPVAQSSFLQQTNEPEQTFVRPTLSNTDGRSKMTEADKQAVVASAMSAVSDKMKPTYMQGGDSNNFLGGWFNKTIANIGNTIGTLDRLGNRNIGNEETAVPTYMQDAERAKSVSEERFTDEAVAAKQQKMDEREAKNDALYNKGIAAMETAKDNTGKVGHVVGDLTGGALDLAADLAANTIIPGSGKAMLAARVFGEAAREQKNLGGTVEQQTIAGLKSAAVELATEMIGGTFDKIYGKSALSNTVNKAIDKLAKTPAVKNALTVLFGAGGEAFEEALADVLNPALDGILNLAQEGDGRWSNWKNTWTEEGLQDMLYDAFLGGVLGAVGGGVNVAADRPAQIQAAEAAAKAAETARAEAERSAREQAETDAQNRYRNFITNSEGYTQKANQILRDPELLSHFQEEFGAVNGDSNTARANDIIAKLREAERQTAIREQTDAEEYNRMADTLNAEEDARIRQENIDEVNRVLNGRVDASKANIIANTKSYADAFTAISGIDISNMTHSEARNAIRKFADSRKNANAPVTQNNAQNSVVESDQQITPPTEQTDATESLTRENVAQENTEPQETATAPETAPESTPQKAKPRIPTVAEAMPLSEAGGGRPIVNPERALNEGTKRSVTESNTLQDVARQTGGVQETLTYQSESEDTSLRNAEARIGGDYDGTASELQNQDNWTNEDVDAALTIQTKYQQEYAKTHSEEDLAKVRQMAVSIQQHGTQIGQSLQAFKKWTRKSGDALSVDGIAAIEEAYAKLSDEDKARLSTQRTNAEMALLDCANEFDSIAEGDAAAAKELIKKLAKHRNTWTFGNKNVDHILGKINDEAYLRNFITSQMSAISQDFAKAASSPAETIGAKLKTWQVCAQLTRVPTFLRNIGGNISFGAIDTMSQDGFGVALDHLVSKFTGKRTVGFDKGWLSSRARKTAWDAMRKSTLEVALDVNIGGGNKYSNGSNRTNTMASEKVSEQFMSRWEQLLGYSLTTSDRTSRGLVEANQAEALEAIRNRDGSKGLTDEEIAQIADESADYRLFQNEGVASGISKGIHDVLNIIGVGGEGGVGRNASGKVTVRPRTGGFGVGDLINPYPGVPANLAVKAFEYSPANIASGAVKLVKTIKDAKAGNFNAAQQHDAVMSIARGLTGTPIIALLTALIKTGCVKNSDDEDDYDVSAQNAAEGKTGVQINLDAISRAFKGDSTTWEDGDDLLSIGWLEPLNAFMAIASLIAEDDDDNYVGNYLEGSIQAVLEMPVMGNIANMIDTFRYSTADNIGGKAADAAIQLAGDTASGFIPAPISQTARAFDPYYRDVTGNSKAQNVVNNLKSSIPGLRQTLNKKQDNYGNDKMYTGTQFDRLMNTFVLPGAVNTLTQTDVSAEVERVYNATGVAGVYPERKAPNTITYTVNGEKFNDRLTTEQKDRYHQIYGDTAEQLIEEVMKSSNYKKLSDEDKAEILTAIYSEAANAAKDDYFAQSGVAKDKSASEADDVANVLVAKTMGSLANITGNGDSPQDFDMIDAAISGTYKFLRPKDRDSMSNAGTWEKLYNASMVGIKSEQWYGIKEDHDAIADNKSYTNSEKQNVFAEYLANSNLTDSQKKLISDQMKFTSITSASAEDSKYNKLVASGVSDNYALPLTLAVSKAKNGKSSIPSSELSAAILSQKMPFEDTFAAYKEYGVSQEYTAILLYNNKALTDDERQKLFAEAFPDTNNTYKQKIRSSKNK